MKKSGIHLDTEFNFYKYGPYSPNLTNLYYTVLNSEEKELKKLPDAELTDEEKEIIKKFKRNLNKWASNAKILEFYTSLLFISRDMYIQNKNKEKIKTILKNYKPSLFTEKLFSEAYDYLEAEGLI